jgi:hypothetical protein
MLFGHAKFIIRNCERGLCQKFSFDIGAPTNLLTPLINGALSLAVAAALRFDESEYDHEKEAFLSLLPPPFDTT